MNNNFLDKNLEKVLHGEKKDGENIEKVLLLTTKLQEKDKKIYMKRIIDKKGTNN